MNRIHLQRLTALTIGLVFLFAFGCTPKPKVERNIELPPVLSNVKKLIQDDLNSIDNDIRKAAIEVSTAPLDGAIARQALLALRTRNPNIVDCATVDLDGNMVAIEPVYYAQFEGMYVGDQEHFVRLFKSKKPAMSKVFRAVEGFNSVAIAWPIIAPDGKLCGAVSALVRPESLLTQIIGPQVQGFPIDFCVTDTEGLTLYDPDFEEIGRNMFTDPLYAPFKELIALGRQTMKYPEGTGAYTFTRTGLKETVSKRATWTSVGLHNTEWRLVMITLVSPYQADAKRTLDDLHLATYTRALSELALDTELASGLAENNEEYALGRFAEFIKYYPAMYAVQWINNKAISMFGYPVEHSFKNYSFHEGRTGNESLFLRALDGRKEASFVIKLIEGGRGEVHLVPVSHEGSFIGMLYSIRLLP